MFNKFFSGCQYKPQLRRYSPTKLCDGAMRGSMVDIQYAMAGIRRGKKKNKKEGRNHGTKI